MSVVGLVLMLIFAGVALGVSGLMLWSGWRAFQHELLPNFKTIPPGPRSLLLTLIGVILPVLGVAVFTLYLAVWLVQVGVAGLGR